MRAETRVIYPFWDLTPPAIPARSRLYLLEPMGVGTSEVESLASYVLRLAAAHCLPLAALFDEIVAPLVQEARPLSTRGYPGFVRVNAARAINGMGVTAAACIQALELLTLRTDLRWLTALTWQGIFTTRYWLRPARAWCPACFESQRREERTVFEPLLWTLRVVTVCPIHKRALVAVCPHCRGESLPMTRCLRPGRCAKCTRWLGELDVAGQPPDESMSSDWDWRLWAAKAAGELFAAPPGMIARPERATLIEAIARCVDHFTEGRAHAFAYHFGLNKSLLWKCLKGHCLPSLETILRISYLSGLSPLDFVNGIDVFPDPAARQGMFVCPPNQHSPNKYRRYGQERLMLQEALNETPPPSPAEVTTRLRYCRTSVLRHAHPELYQQLESRHMAFRQEQRVSRMSEGVREGLAARQIISASLQEYPPPSAREVARRLGYSRHDQLLRCFPEFYRQILDHRRKYQKQIDESVRNCFQSAISEDPPPRISELARRLGFISAATLKSNYPDICRALDARRLAYHQRRLKQVETILKQACHEMPAPSLMKLAGRCGYQTIGGLTCLFPELCRQIAARYAAERKDWAVRIEAQLRSALDEAVPLSVKELSYRLKCEKGTLYRYFPELCAELSARRARHLKEEIVKRGRRRREEIRRIVIELHKRGIYPSYARVQEQISEPSVLSRPSDCEALREVKRELGIHMTRK